MFEIGFSQVVCPLKLEALLEYFSRMLQPRVDVYRLCWQSLQTSTQKCILAYFEEYLPCRSILCKQEHVNTQNGAKLMDQERAEFPKTSVEWMVLRQSFLVLPQECILVLQ